jgi:hypothetical protein
LANSKVIPPSSCVIIGDQLIRPVSLYHSRLSFEQLFDKATSPSAIFSALCEYDGVGFYKEKNPISFWEFRIKNQVYYI